MQGRASGMPPKEVWEGCFSPAEILDIMGLNHDVSDVAAFGCGYGTVTIPAARVGRGTVHAIDIDAAMVAATRHAAAQHGLLREAWRVLKPGGRAGILHWVCEPRATRDPTLSLRDCA